MCVEAAVCYALGLPHSDNPPCVGTSIRKVKIKLNDCNWSSNKARAEGMRKIAIAQLGSNEIDQNEFDKLMKLKFFQKVLPYIIQKYYNSLEKKDEKLLEYKKQFENLAELDNNLWKEFYNYYYYYNSYNNSYNNNDDFFLIIADTILQSLIELKSPGCE